MILSSRFKAMHYQKKAFLLPTVWDVQTAIILEQAGFKAIGTTSWGVANSLGYKDGQKISFDVIFSLARKIISAVNIPVSIDIESGYSEDPSSVVNNVLKLADLGVSGINIEDSLKHEKGLKNAEILNDQNENIVLRNQQ